MVDLDYEVIFRDSPIGIVGQKDGELILANQRYADILEYQSPEDLIGLEIRDVFAEDESEKIHKRAIRRERGKEEPKRYVSKLETKFGKEVDVEIHVSKMKMGDEKINIAFVKDISKLRKTVKKLEKSNKDLQQFAYIASHDLQEPLRMISSYINLIADKYQGEIDEKMDKYIKYAVDGANHLQDMIQGLLQYSRVGTRGEEFEKVDLNSILDVVIQNFEIKIEETNAEILVDVLPPTYGDPSQLAHLFQNLIDNAIKFRKMTPKVKIYGESGTRYNTYYVEDNGIGIEEEYLDEIFELFSQLHSKADYAGTGIGLALCNKIVKRHGGELLVKSENDEGSTFIIKLPKEEN